MRSYLNSSSNRGRLTREAARHTGPHDIAALESLIFTHVIVNIPLLLVHTQAVQVEHAGNLLNLAIRRCRVSSRPKS